MFAQRTVAALAISVSSALLCLPVHAVPFLDPSDFASLGALPGGIVTIDTDANLFGGVIISQGGTTQTNTPQDPNGNTIEFIAPPEILVLTFDGGAVLSAGDVVSVTGSRSLALLFQGTFQLSGTININGGDGVSNTAGVAGAGGYSGGRGGSACSGGDQPGAGPGGGTDGRTAAVSGASGGGGGGHGSAGGNGSANVTGNAPGGTINGNLVQTLQGGSGGGGGAGLCAFQFPGGGGGGAGGGALEVGALASLGIDGLINASGGDGGDGGRDGGGGAGGGVRLHAFDIDLTGVIDASGGNGSTNAGCGGGGRVLFITNQNGALANTGTVDVSAGTPGCPDRVGIVRALEDPDVGTAPNNGGATVPAPATLGLLALILPWMAAHRYARSA